MASGLRADIPYFWLDAPTERGNVNDPRSPYYSVRTPLPIAPAGTPTSTPTITETHTISPTITPSPSVLHGSLVTDAENGLTPAWSGGPGGIFHILDAYGSTAAPDPFTPSAGGNTLPAGTAGNAFCLSGNLLAEIPAIPQWPFAGLHIELAYGALSAGQPGVDISPYAPGNSLTFSFRAQSTGVSYRVELITDDVSDFGYFRYIFSPVDTNWHQYTVYFPDSPSTPKLAQPPWAAPRSWNAPLHQKRKVKGISFQVQPTGAPQAYGFCVDDVTFAALLSPTATATATPTVSSTPGAVTSTFVPTSFATGTFTTTLAPSATRTATRTRTQTPTPPPPTFAGTPTVTNVPSATGTATPTRTPTPQLSPTASPTSVPTYDPSAYILFEDFESGTSLLDGYIYSDGVATVAASTSTSTARAGQRAALFQVSTAGSIWGAGGGFGSNYGKPIDATGAQKLVFHVLSDRAIEFSVSLKELHVLGSDPSNEDWSSGNITVPGDGNWHLIEVAMPGAFSESSVNPDCTPNCSSTGNGVMDLDKSYSFDLRFNPGASTLGASVFVDDIYFSTSGLSTATRTPTQVSTFTPSPTLTRTPTPASGADLIWYDGDTAGAMAADVTFVNETSTSMVSEAASGGYGGGAYYNVSYNVPAAGYFSSADIARPATDVSAFNQLEFRLRVPSSGGGCFNGGVQLVTGGTAPNDRSRPVTVTVYAASALAGDTWVHVRVPLAAFNGPNHQMPSYSFSASDLTGITAVRFVPYYNDYNADGSFTGGVGVDSVIFSVGAPAPAQRALGPLLSNFETNTASNWGGFWTSYTDQDAPDFACAPAAPTSRIFPSSASVAPIMSDGAGAAFTPCSYGRIAGHKGGDGTGSGAGTCGTNNWSYSGMGLNFDPAGGTASVDVPTAIGFTPSALRFRIKTGTNHQAGQQYIITLTLNAPQNTCGGCEWQLQFEPTATWQTVTAPFPANGTVGTGVTPSQTAWGQPSWAGTPLTWDATTWTLFRQIAIAPANSNQDFDAHWDDIEFIP